MSYSIGPVRAASKALALAALGAAFDAQVLPSQPDHAHDRDAHLANVERQLALLPDPSPDQDVSLTMNGWLSWNNLPDGGKAFTGGGFGGGAQLVAREVPKG